MSGGSIVRVIAALALVAVLVGIGIGVYNAGVTAGLAETGRTAVASGAPVVYYPGPYVGHGWGPGFGFFGFFFWVLGIFLIFALVRAAFGFGRWGRGHRGWDDHQGPGDRGGPGSRGRPRDHFEDWHRQAHEPGGDAGAG